MSSPAFSKSAFAVMGVALLLLAGLGSSLYTVDSREVAVVLSFGAPVRTVTEPGLYARLPWPLHEVVRFDRRARVLAAPPTELLTHDKKNLVVEAFTLWRVQDPQRFLESFRQPVDEIRWEDLVQAAELGLGDLVTSRIAAALGEMEFADLLSVESAGQELLPQGLAQTVAGEAADRFGIQLLDLRLRHVGLPLQNEQSIYERMRAERSRIANAYRSEGEEKATTIRARADRQAAEILAEADKEAARIMAEAEAAAARLYAETYRKDPEFYRYLRSLDVLRTVLAEGNEQGESAEAVLVLDSESELFSPLTRSPR